MSEPKPLTAEELKLMDLSENLKSEGSAATLPVSESLLAEFARRRGKPDAFLFVGDGGNPPDDRDLWA